ncbi:type II toxin-antitoxin system Phd/YefM family antitoxin [Ruminiclostridium cellobioparum]|uniref:Prevent-host-death family protein n=1 Tax=Ruminiclostridium cellobioparum subsp. termitidis CT1112 TaxID=1195236 RepID=S0FG29_RUMCE|nr:type II toxin-antitoxin system Phd/YefM family antitoxin [Ruminiclostridium cellobioparum]EMS69787.1 prevent-host-death family protein [Ruminiclostridium cellobioparum subsp. termitidis CT1112]
MDYETKVITATELKLNLGKYLDLVSNDNEVIITKNGKKAIRLTPYINDIERYFTVKEKALDYRYGGKKVSYEEFMEIYENSELRMEYINGEIVLLSSPSTFHQVISGNLHVILRNYLKGKTCKVFYAPFDVHFFKKDLKTPDVMQPDLLIACDLENTVTEKGRYMGTPTLVVEILSRSTRSKDMVDKLNTYMLSGVKEFWVIDPKNKSVLLYGFKDCEIDFHSVSKNNDIVTSYWFKDLEVTLEDIFEG